MSSDYRLLYAQPIGAPPRTNNKLRFAQTLTRTMIRCEIFIESAVPLSRYHMGQRFLRVHYKVRRRHRWQVKLFRFTLVPSQGIGAAD